ncbi:hypothetical protein ACFLX9_00970 [Chloroflexota bacterium]
MRSLGIRVISNQLSVVGHGVLQMGGSVAYMAVGQEIPLWREDKARRLRPRDGMDALHAGRRPLDAGRERSPPPAPPSPQQ